MCPSWASHVSHPGLGDSRYGARGSEIGDLSVQTRCWREMVFGDLKMKQDVVERSGEGATSKGTVSLFLFFHQQQQRQAGGRRRVCHHLQLRGWREGRLGNRHKAEGGGDCGRRGFLLISSSAYKIGPQPPTIRDNFINETFVLEGGTARLLCSLFE